MDFKDYYEILGVSPQADKKEIKKVYQTLAKKYHPDKNPGNKEAEEKFKEINEAYHAIADPAKRKKYDDLRSDYQQWKNRGGAGSGRDSFDWSAWQGSPGQAGGYSRTMTPEEFSEMFGDRGFSAGGGTGGFSDFFSTIFGMGQDSGFGSGGYYSNVASPPRAGRDIQGEITVSLEEAYQGAKKLMDIGSKRIEATIPKGIKDNNKIRLAGQGQAGARGAKAGDLFLTVKVSPHPHFVRDGDDLRTNVDIDFYTAVLGGEARVKTLAGEILLKIPPKTQTGRSFRLKDKGMPVMNQLGKYGDLYAKISIVLPSEISDKEIDTLKELKSQKN